MQMCQAMRKKGLLIDENGQTKNKHHFGSVDFFRELYIILFYR